jgi:hypothetical protein
MFNLYKFEQKLKAQIDHEQSHSPEALKLHEDKLSIPNMKD